MPTIKLQSSDGEIFPVSCTSTTLFCPRVDLIIIVVIFQVDVEIAKQSVTIKTMLDDLGMEEDVSKMMISFESTKICYFI